MADLDHERRQFFKSAVWSMGKAVHEYCEQQKDAPREPQPSPLLGRTDWLRPPGAVEESLFIDRCTRCGDCLPACPYGSIKKDPGTGYPVVFANESPCFLCEEFPCIAACETEALVSVTTRHEVRMGVAVVNRKICTADQGCQFCITKCPVDALHVHDSVEPYPVVQEDICVGCGICEQVCATVNDKIAIKVKARRFSEGSQCVQNQVLKGNIP